MSGTALHQKTDVFKRMMWYLYKENEKQIITCLTVGTVKEIIEKNAKGVYPDSLKGVEESGMASMIEYQNAVGLESLTRFEDQPNKTEKPKNKSGNRKKQGNKKPYRKDRRKGNNKQGKKQQ